MGGDYTKVIPIPVDDPNVEAIAGALFKPEGGGPCAAVIYLPACDGVGSELGLPLEKHLIDHLLSKGIATLIVDPYTARGEAEGVCVQHGLRIDRSAKDAHSAMNVLSAMPDINAERIFLQGYDAGASSALLAVGSSVSAPRRKFAGVVAYYPLCGWYEFGAILVPALVMLGDKDDVAMSRSCEAMSGTANVEMVVYPDATHGFAIPGVKGDYFGHVIKYDAKAAEDAQARGDAFMAAHTK